MGVRARRTKFASRGRGGEQRRATGGFRASGEDVPLFGGVALAFDLSDGRVHLWRQVQASKPKEVHGMQFQFQGTRLDHDPARAFLDYIRRCALSHDQKSCWWLVRSASSHLPSFHRWSNNHVLCRSSSRIARRSPHPFCKKCNCLN